MSAGILHKQLPAFVSDIWSIQNMIIDQNITTYIHSLAKDNPQAIEQIRRAAEDEGIPIIRREMESFLRTLLRIKAPQSILEIGAGVGYSALFMATNTPSYCHITTIENYPPRIEKAKKNIEQTGMKGRVTLIADDAAKVIAGLDGGYDFIFLDSAKGQYMDMLPHILRLLDKDGLLLADNVLQDGSLVRSRFAHARRQRTIHKRMRDFVWTVMHCDELESTLITIGDGVTLSCKK